MTRRAYSPRHVMPLNARDVGVSNAEDDVAGNVVVGDIS